MIVVIQCAARKIGDGYFLTQEGRRVLFVADPRRAPPLSGVIFARPDDPSDEGVTWREQLLQYSQTAHHNPFGLATAGDLYENPTYRLLTDRYGAAQTYVLSAGFGLIPSTFLTPLYDITFSVQAAPHARRRRNSLWHDFAMLPPEAEGPILFFGGKDYVPLFAELTADTKAERIVFFNAAIPPLAHGCTLRRFETPTRTNWHYECAKAIASGAVRIQELHR